MKKTKSRKARVPFRNLIEAAHAISDAGVELAIGHPEGGMVSIGPVEALDLGLHRGSGAARSASSEAPRQAG
jgi:hypothetical protein